MRGKVHFLGSHFASRAACGRMILVHREAETRQPRHTANKAEVTCSVCLKVLEES